MVYRSIAFATCLACAYARYQAPAATPVSRITRSNQNGKRKILMLISDTGGGHRASANALDQMMMELRSEAGVDDTEVRIVDIWTECGAWPHNKMAAGYPWLCKNPWAWRAMYFISTLCEKPWSLETRLCCGRRFRQYIEDYDPDLVVSLHPLCQNLPLQILRRMGRREQGIRFVGNGGSGDYGGSGRTTPFAVVCTDLGGAHPSWFRREVDAVFVPSDAVRDVARKRGVDDSKIFQHGLPVRSDFWRASAANKKHTEEQYEELGLESGRKTVLIVGGGDGVGSLSQIVDTTAKKLASECPNEAQVVALCGKNTKLRDELEAKKAAGEWDGVEVAVRGFTSEISRYMDVADCLVTKAGPGTIAEAATRALPTMLSSFLPGQEAGNVPFVLNHGFGEYSPKPAAIADRVSAWLQDDKMRKEMRRKARAAATPQATRMIAMDLLKLLDDPPKVML